MNEAHELAMIVCKQCLRNQNESDIEFSTRLYSVYTACKENIENLMKIEAPTADDSTSTFLGQFSQNR